MQKTRFAIDRFNKAIFADDMSDIEGIDLIKKNLNLMRIESVEDELMPFTKDSVSQILNIWRSERPTIREFRSKCRRVLRGAAWDGIKETDGRSAANYIHRLYGNWERCFLEWKDLKPKHRTLQYAIFNVLDKCKDSPDIRYDDVALEVTYDISSDEKIRNDILIVPHGRLPVAIEIERGQISKERYRKIADLIKRDEYSGVIIITSSFKENLSANRIALGILKDASKYDVIRIKEDVLNLGQCLSFAALSPELNFPFDDNCRNELQQSLKEDDASLLVEKLKIRDAINKIARQPA